MANDTITSLAILKVNWDTQGKDYIENFVPFVVEVLQTVCNEQVDIADLKKRMLQNYGLDLPMGSVALLLKRAQKRGFLKLEFGKYSIVKGKFDESRFEKTKTRVLREHSALIEKLRLFSKSQYSVNWNQDETDSALLEYLKSHEIEVLISATEGTVIPSVGKSPRSSNFIVSSFARHLFESDPEGFQYLETIVKGFILANALIYQGISKINKKYTKTTFYLDTPFLFDLLGLGGEERKKLAEEVIQFLYVECSNLRIFRHTLEEMGNVLDYCASKLSRRELTEPVPRVLNHMIENEYSQSDVEFIKAKLPQTLESFKIKCVEKPKYDPNYQIDEKKLEEQLATKMNYQRESALKKDVDSLSAIFRLRRGKNYQALEDSPAIFVTTNAALARTSTEFISSENYNFLVPLCMTSHLLSHLLWLKKPHRFPDLPKRQIIASAYAAMTPSEDLWKKYVNEIKKLRDRNDLSDDDVYILRTTLEAKRELMELTQGTESNLHEETVTEILSKIKSQIIAEEQKKYKELENQHLKTVKELQLEKTSRATQITKFENFGSKIASVVSKSLFVITTIFLIAGILKTIPQDLGNISKSKLIPPVAFFLLLILTIANLLFGTTVKGLIRVVDLKIRKFLIVKLEKYLGPE